MSSSAGPRKTSVGKAFPDQLIKVEIGTAGWEPGKLTPSQAKVLTVHAQEAGFRATCSCQQDPVTENKDDKGWIG